MKTNGSKKTESLLITICAIPECKVCLFGWWALVVCVCGGGGGRGALLRQAKALIKVSLLGIVGLLPRALLKLLAVLMPFHPVSLCMFLDSFDTSKMTGQKAAGAPEVRGARHQLENSSKNFARGAKDTFLLTKHRELGPLVKIRLGHDNSGEGPGEPVQCGCARATTAAAAAVAVAMGCVCSLACARIPASLPSDALISNLITYEFATCNFLS